MKQNNNENWVRPESERRERRDMRDQDIRTGRNRNTSNVNRGEAVPTRRRKKKKESYVGARILLFLGVFVVLTAIVAGSFAIFFFHTPDKIGSDMKITYDKKTLNVDEATAYRDGKLFISFTRIADMLSMTRTGDADTAKFILASEDSKAVGTGAEEYAEFHRDSTVAFVSGTEIRLSENCVFSRR